MIPQTEANSNDVCSHPEAASVIAAFLGEFTEVTEQQRELTETFLGSANIVTPAALRNLLHKAERLDRYGVSQRPAGKGLHWNVPSALPRFVWRAIRSLISAPGRALGRKQR